MWGLFQSNPTQVHILVTLRQNIWWTGICFQIHLAMCHENCVFLYLNWKSVYIHSRIYMYLNIHEYSVFDYMVAAWKPENCLFCNLVLKCLMFFFLLSDRLFGLHTSVTPPWVLAFLFRLLQTQVSDYGPQSSGSRTRRLSATPY